MTELKRVSNEALKTISERTATRPGGHHDDIQSGKPVGVDADIYDALDYRLMETFPASDAVAQY